MIFYSKHMSLQTEHFPFIVCQVEILCISMPNPEGCFLKYIQASSRIIKVISTHGYQQGCQCPFENGFPHSLIHLVVVVVAIQLSFSCKVQGAK